MEEGWAVVISSLMGLIGVLAGAWIVSVNQRRSDERSAAHAREASDSERRARLEDRRREGQLSTLMELQEVVRRRVRVTILIVEHDRRVLKERGTFSQLGETEDREDYEAAIAYSHLTTRVLDSRLRAQLVEFGSRCAAYSVPPVAAASESREHALADLQDRFHSLIRDGEVLAGALGDALRRELSHGSSDLAAHSG